MHLISKITDKITIITINKDEDHQHLNRIKVSNKIMILKLLINKEEIHIVIKLDKKQMI